MNKDFTATLSQGSYRYSWWIYCFGSNEVILKHPIPKWGNFPKEGKKLYYELDLEALTPEQRDKLIKHLARTFDVPVEEVKRDIDEMGVPILADEVILSIKNPQKWL